MSERRRFHYVTLQFQTVLLKRRNVAFKLLLGRVKYMVLFQKITSEPSEIRTFDDPLVALCCYKSVQNILKFPDFVS